MAGQRQPIDLVIAKGKKHLTKEQIAERRASEVKPITDNIIAPSYLTKKQQADFYTIAEQLKKLKIMGETDVDVLARYISARDLYISMTKKLRGRKAAEDPTLLDLYSKLQDRYFKQCRASANDLGLSISSRCKLVVPKVESDEPKENKFARFKKPVSG